MKVKSYKHIIRIRTRVLILFVTCALAVGALNASIAHAVSAVIIVNDLGDNLHNPGCATTGSGDCTLRDAITFANSNTGADTIVFSSSGTILLGSTLPNINDDLTINANGAGQDVTISGNNSVPVMIVNSAKTLTLDQLTIANGNSSLGAAGAIYNRGTLNVINSTFNKNSALEGGGAIANDSGATLNLSNSTFTANSATYGAGIHNAGTLNISNSTFYTGNASNAGGGIYNIGTMTILNTTFSQNRAPTGEGIYNGGGTATFKNTLIGDNGANAECFSNGTITTSSTNNLADDNTCGSGFTVKTLAQIGFGLCGAWGGPTATCSIQNPSAAIDTGDNSTCAAAPVNGVDQRGLVRPQDGDGNGTAVCDIGSFELGVNEPNDTFDQATNITPKATNCTPFIDYIEFPNDVDLFSFTDNNANIGMNLDLTNLPHNYDLRLYDASGNLVATSNNPGTEDEHILNYIPINTGTYYAEVFGVAGASDSQQTYTLTVCTGNPPTPTNTPTPTFTPSPTPTNTPTPTFTPSPTPTNTPTPTFTPSPTPSPTILTVEDENPAMQYNGWRGVFDPGTSNGSYRVSTIAGDFAKFKFTGTLIQWVTFKGPDQGKAQVTLDDVNQPVVDLYSAARQSFVWVSPRLTNAAHTIQIKVLGQNNAQAIGTNVAVDAFFVGATKTEENSNQVQWNKWVGTTNQAASAGTYRSSSASSAVASLTFSGDSIDWLTEMGPNMGKAKVTITNTSVCPPANPCSFDLYSASAKWVSKSFTHVGSGQHTIQITPLHTKNASSTGYKVIVDAFSGPIMTTGTWVPVSPEEGDSNSGDINWLFCMFPIGVIGSAAVTRRRGAHTAFKLDGRDG